MAEMASHQQPSSAGSGGTGGGTGGGGGGGGGNNSQSQVKTHITLQTLNIIGREEAHGATLSSSFAYGSVCLARCRPAAPLRVVLSWSVRR